MYSRFTNANYYASQFHNNYRNYGTQKGLEDGLYQIKADRTRYTPEESLYEKTPARNFSKLFESQFFEKIKTPEQAKVVQQTIAKEGR